MSTETPPADQSGTKPHPAHEWIQQLVGDWATTCEMTMPDGSKTLSKGRERVVSLGGLWAVGEGTVPMPDGETMDYRTGMGYDVSFKGYRGFWVMSMSSHLWKYEGTLSADGKVMTMNCTGPDMVHDGQTAAHRDIHTIVDANHRKVDAYFPGENGKWELVMSWEYTRA